MSEQPQLEWNDRYGGKWPDPKTVCDGPCEGMGTWPAYSRAHDTLNSVDRCTPIDDDHDAIVAVGATPGDDGWAFLTCSTCGGTGRIG